MSTVKSKDGTSIAFDQSGSGPAVILVDGAFQHRAIDDRTTQLAAHLAHTYTVFRYDRRGRGESGDTLPYAVGREIEDLAVLIGEAGGSASVFGMSSGAILALQAAAYGLPIGRLALYEPPFIVDASRLAVSNDFIPRLSTLLSEGNRGDAVALFLTEAVGVPSETVTAMRSTPDWPTLEAVAHTLRYDALLMGDTLSGNRDALQQWASVNIPTLVLDGGASPEQMHQAAAALSTVLPNAERRTLPGQTHAYDPEILAPVLAAFL